MVAIDAAMPGSWARVSPFLQRLPALQPGQKAAAVNLGIFPDASGTAVAYSAPQPNYTQPTVTASVTTDRLADIDALLNPVPPPPTAAPQPVQVAYAAPVTRQPVQPQPVRRFAPRKIWLQLASGSNPAELPEQFARIKSRDRDLFEGIPGYVARSPDRARLVIGPFRSVSDADTFAADLETLQVNAFKWSNSATDQIVPIGTE
jgi:hypothetical protein